MTKAKAKTEAEAADDQTDSVASDAAEEAASTLDETTLEPELEVVDGPEDDASAEVTRLQERVLRLQADFDNFRKRTLRERQETARRAQDDVILDMLPALDHLELAIQSAASHDVDEQFLTGFTMVSGELIRVLANFGLKRIETLGTAFDHNVHEAVSQMPSDDHAEDVVIHEVKSGYMVGDRLLRAAQVVVSSGAPASGDDKAEA